MRRTGTGLWTQSLGPLHLLWSGFLPWVCGKMGRLPAFKNINDLRTLPEALMNDEGLLAEVEDLLRSSPPQSAFTAQEPDEALSWLGRTSAVINKWNVAQGICLRHARTRATGGGEPQHDYSPWSCISWT